MFFNVDGYHICRELGGGVLTVTINQMNMSAIIEASGGLFSLERREKALLAAQLVHLNPDYLTSSVHISNESSIRLHKRLGFQVTEQTKGRLLFMLKKTLLMQQMARLGGK
ncbi:MAG: hypothetical protein CENE_00985 [Candidatus Celerinatantimonas neptuna]|nr:MAG: hypothetical protein CENE_00985 [Candidatus Celerinatantimonas neptuna]